MARELYYLVESISTATERNENFAGNVHLYYHGKGDELLFADTPDKWINTNKITPYFVREYGYKRKCDAKRCSSYTHPQNDKYWETEVRVVTAWVRKDGRVFIGA